MNQSSVKAISVINKSTVQSSVRTDGEKYYKWEKNEINTKIGQSTHLWDLQLIGNRTQL